MSRPMSKKKLSSTARIDDAKRWLRKCIPIHPLTDAYMKRYGVERWLAQEELMAFGHKETVQVENLDREGIEWEYQYDPLSDELKPVPKGTEEHELYLFMETIELKPKPLHVTGHSKCTTCGRFKMYHP